MLGFGGRVADISGIAGSVLPSRLAFTNQVKLTDKDAFFENNRYLFWGSRGGGPSHHARRPKPLKCALGAPSRLVVFGYIA